jgi:NAD(P)-dependent dehydrogenase (short-subunit alcohol dehydrogenase family)
VLVAGASGGIGHALSEQVTRRFPDAALVRLARDTESLQPLTKPTLDVGFDIGSEQAIREAVALLPESQPVDWILVATGWLHDEQRLPEKSYKGLEADNLLYAYRINAVGPALLVKHLLPRMERGFPGRIGVLSARVGSISDNRLGGWHAYRASKAALNMLIRNYAIELARTMPSVAIVGLQPGTTDTALSAPFQRNVPPGQLQTTTFTAQQLIEVMTRLDCQDSGGLFDFEGLSFDP